jgi:hypothetical protein
MNEDEPPPCRNDMVDLPKVDFLHPVGRVSFEASSLPTVVEEDDADIQNEINANERNDSALVVPCEATTHPDPVAHVDLSHIKELQSMEVAYIDEKSPEFDDIVSQLEQDVESSLLTDIMPEPVPVSNSPDGQGDFNDSTLSLPSITQDSEDEPDSLMDNEADVVNDYFDRLHQKDGSPCDMRAITNHRISRSGLQLEIEWCSGYKSWAKFSDVKSDDPALVARYVLTHKINEHVPWV